MFYCLGMRLAQIFAVSLLMIATLGAQGKGKGQGKGQDKGASPVRSGDTFSGDRRVVTEYFRALPPSNLPPGLAKRGGSLPPGLEKQLQRNGTLPPGLAKRVEPFPPELERRLPPLAPELRRGLVEGRVVIFNTRTSVILDVFLPF
jgi:hypothetical protein